VNSCRGCQSDKIVKILNFGDQPWCNDFLTKDALGEEKYYPLEVVCCSECELLQLSYTVPKEVMFFNHQYLSSMTSTLGKHFLKIATENKEQFDLQKDDLIVDIGGNDGFQLMQYKNVGLNNVINVESAENICDFSKAKGIKTINSFFNEKTAKENFEKQGTKLVNASGVFFHLEELHSVIKGIKYMLANDGVFVIQFMYAGAMVENNNFDTVYHEHLCYYTLKNVIDLLRKYDLEVFDAYYTDIHSGSIIAKATHKGGPVDKKTTSYIKTKKRDEKYTLQEYKTFFKKVESYKDELYSFLRKLKDEGHKIYAYGAPAKGNTLLNYCKVDNTIIEKAVEINTLKLGFYMPQSHIPIVLEDKEDLPDYYLLLSHNFADEIIKKNKDILEKGVKFIIPFPRIEVRGITDVK
tara:strand:- start:1606 stop:2832 length:1227 start_codon:yes stop_codon:yes gene_type:complete